MWEQIEKPDFVKDEYLEYLDDLRDSGVTNMYGAAAYLAEDCPELSIEQSKELLLYWMRTFGERHPK